MIRKLRWRFIAISMASLFAVLLIIMGIANVLNYQSVVRGADETLELLLEYNGVFPEFQNLTPGNRPDGQIPVRPEDDHDEDDDFDDLFDRDDDDSHTDLRLVGRRGGRTFSEETPYSSRYFTVIFDQAGAIQSVNTDRIFAVDEDEAETFATKALATHKSSGFLDVYRFAAKNSDGSTIVVFLDCEERLSTFHNFLLTSVAISVGGMLAVFLLMLLLSKRIVRPFIDNYEKQKRFITDAGHEIKTPIAVIQADTEVLEMDLGEDNEWLHDIQTQTEKLTSLTNDLVMLSRMEEAGRNIQMIEFPFSDVVTEAAGSFKALALTQNKTFETDIEPMLSLTGDEKAVRQLVSILLDNAVKYCPEGGDICLSAKSTGKSITLSTYNSSAPVEKESLKHIFDRFYRLDSSRNAKTGGYGIGLSIARAVMEAHKGKIEATTKDGTSVTITATFPVK
ncbi:MAG: HAMP domain-containing histidine kinase [Lachnospiraceae bacterium]|nr:HAMP domain-containing histidine kinase [Lachnospiraceae bacterium]